MSEIADLTVKEALALLEKDNVSSELLEQAEKKHWWQSLF